MIDFESLLSLTPSLAQLKLISYRSNLDSVFHGSYWKNMIQTKLHSLKTFQFFFSYTLLEKDDIKDLDLTINQFRAPFWLLDKKWHTTCDYVLKQRVINFYTTPRCTVVDQQQSISIKKRQHPYATLRFHSLPMDIEFPSIVRLIHTNNDTILSQVCSTILY